MILLFTLMLGACAMFFAELISDIHAPLMPALDRLFGAPGSSAWTMGCYFLPLALSGPFYGSLSERLGRRPVILWGCAFMALGSGLCAWADTPQILLIGRFLQGLGAGSAWITGLSIAKDSAMVVASTSLTPNGYTEQGVNADFAAKGCAKKEITPTDRSVLIIALMSMCSSLAPMSSPIIGGWIGHFWGWRSIFITSAIVGCILWIMLYFYFQETLRTENSIRGKHLNIRESIVLYKERLVHPVFLSYALVSSLLFASIFAFITAAPFLLLRHWNIPLRLYNTYAMIPGACYFFITLTYPWLIKNIDGNKLLRVGAWASAIAGAGIVIGPYYGPWIFIISAGLCSGSMAIVYPITSNRALSCFKEQRGISSATLCFLENVLAGLSCAVAAIIIGTNVLYIGFQLAALLFLSSWCILRKPAHVC